MAESVEQDIKRRTFKPKTKTGCITCRIRRIKCDEAKPACLKCTSTGRKCDGYMGVAPPRASRTPLPITKSTTNNTITTTRHPIPPKKPIAAISMLPFEGTESEIRSFRYFQHETVPQICSFYKDQFWFHSVLQACHHNVAIRHAAIALGSLHEQSASVSPPVPAGMGDLVTGDFALMQYNKAIQALLKSVPGSVRKPEQKIDVALITCVLFACFDALRGHLGTVFHHINGGVKILAELHKESTDTDQETHSSSLYAPISSLTTLFARLDIQSSSMMGTRRLQLVPSPALGPSIETITISTTFKNFEEARDSQDNIFRCWHHDFRRTLTTGAEIPYLEVPDEQETQYLKTAFNSKLYDWSTAYAKFLLANPEKRDRPTDHLLLLCDRFIWLHANVDHAAAASSEMAWDEYAPQFAEIVSHASSIITSTSSGSRRRVLFSLDNVMVSTLYVVASRCRHPVIRRGALRCLKTANRQEGLWESRTLARVAQRVMEIEEEGMRDLVDGTEIPGWKRVSGVFPVLDPSGRKAVIYYTSRPVEEGGLPLTNMKEAIEW